MTQIDTLTQTLKSRFSCRAFRPDPVPDAVITQIVSTARHVPSWCNAQPWQVSITKGAATDGFRARMLEIATAGTAPTPDLAWPKGYSGAYGDRRRTCGFQLYEAVGIEKSDRKARQDQMLRNYALFDAPHVAILHTPEDRLVLCAISFGYADMDNPANRFRTERAEAADIIDWKS
jgi:nitroreductase